MTDLASNERIAVLARFIRNQVGLADRPPPGCIQLNNAEALLCAEALERLSGETPDADASLRRECVDLAASNAVSVAGCVGWPSSALLAFKLLCHRASPKAPAVCLDCELARRDGKSSCGVHAPKTNSPHGEGK